MQRLTKNLLVAATLLALVTAAGTPAFAKHKHTETRWVITLYHPSSGGVVYSTQAETALAAEAQKVAYAKYHWRFWKYFGIGESMHDKMFSSKSGADNHQPAFGIIAEQYTKAGRVTVTTIEVPRKKKRHG
jgi:hypothetical protein